ncbi:MAG: amidohydrolase family protein [Vicinamibacterales bacterium]
MTLAFAPLRRACARTLLLTFALAALAAGAAAQSRPITIRAARVVDGTGATLTNAVVEVRDGRITAIDQRTGPVTYELGDATLLPGLIDVHVHIGYHFGRDGRARNQGETPAEMALHGAENAYLTLMAGFTTVQSVGAASDRELRDAILRGTLPGPRILTSLGSINERTGTADQMREYVRKQKADGADVIKIFASKSIRDGGAQTLTDEQLEAACGEARSVGLRTLVHAQSDGAALAAAKAGCTRSSTARASARRRSPTWRSTASTSIRTSGWSCRTTSRTRRSAVGIGNYNEEASRSWSAVPLNYPMFKLALASKVKMPMGTGGRREAHGQNAREIITRVRDERAPMDAIVSATSLAARSLNMGTDRHAGRRAAGRHHRGGRQSRGPHRGSRSVQFVMRAGRVWEVDARGGRLRRRSAAMLRPLLWANYPRRAGDRLRRRAPASRTGMAGVRRRPRQHPRPRRSRTSTATT